MKIELKKVHFSESLSEETNAFTADVWVNGKKVGYVRNDGHGGNTNVRPYSGVTTKLFNECEDYCKTLPPHIYEHNGESHELKCDFESVVDDLFEKWLKKKEEKKMEKQYIKGIVYKTPSGYTTTYWKGFTIPMMLNSEKGRTTLRTTLERLRGQGKEILNTNLEEI